MQFSIWMGNAFPSSIIAAPFWLLRKAPYLFMTGMLSLQLIGHAANAAPARNPRGSSADSDRLVNSPTDNYVAGTEYADSWRQDRMPLKIFIKPDSSVVGFEPGYVDALKSACQNWTEATGNMVQFQFVDDAASADIDIQWTADVNSLQIKSPNELGLCEPTFEAVPGVVHASISLLTRNKGHRVGLKLMEAVAMHELGHALGLGHSGRDSDVMAKCIESKVVLENGLSSIEPFSCDVRLSKRDVTTMKVVYAAKKTIDDIRNKKLDKHGACVDLFNAATTQISAGDSGQAIILLREILKLDGDCKVAAQNLMVAYFNCGVELYNKQRYSEALPLLDKSLKLGKLVTTSAELNSMRSVRQNCSIALTRSNRSPPPMETAETTAPAAATESFADQGNSK